MSKAAEQGATGGFGGLGLDAGLVKTLGELGYEEPTPIQSGAIPPMLAGRDVIGQAATGTGKTAAFALPMLQRVAAAGADRAKPSALVLVPTRELAMQVAEAMHKYGQKLKVTTIPVYGGQPFGLQARMLDRGVDVVVATPGRALDHMRRGTMNLGGIAVLTLDEADEMLDMGFADDLEAILSETPATRQTVFFSATLPPRIAGMVKRHQRDPVRVQIEKEPGPAGAAPKVRQTAYIIPRAQKLEVLGRVLDLENPASALVFCRTRTEVDGLTERLCAHGYRAQALHGGITQDQRSRVVKRLKDGAIDLVVATDVAARGLDIEQLALVVNYDVPATPDAYVHRIGRVGRAGRAGVAITLADPRESRLLRQFERQVKGRIEVAMVPTVADLRAKRMEQTTATIRDTIAAGGLDRFRVAVETLAREHDVMSVALAAVKLAHQAGGGDRDGEDVDPPARAGPPAKVAYPAKAGHSANPAAATVPKPAQAAAAAAPSTPSTPPVVGAGPAVPAKAARASKPIEPFKPIEPSKPAEQAKPSQPVRATVPAKAAEPAKPGELAKPAEPAKPASATKQIVEATHPAPPPAKPASPPKPVEAAEALPVSGGGRLYIGIGQVAGIGAKELTAAISREGKLKADQIGVIEITSKYSVVEVPEPLAEQVLRSMRAFRVSGRKVAVRRYVEKEP